MDQSLLLLPPLQEVLKTVQERQLKILSNTVLHRVITPRSAKPCRLLGTLCFFADLLALGIAHAYIS